jgi:hypothetical protein
MKNLIYIDVDTDREKQILIGKGSEIKTPETREEARDMIINDIKCVCETLKILIDVADFNNYAKKDELITESIKELSKMLVENNNNK